MVGPDRERFRNEDLILKVSPAVARSQWNEDRYEPFLDELCGDREYQKAAIRTVLRYVNAGTYPNLRALARESFDNSSVMQAKYGSLNGLERALQFPDQLAASVDLATGTGKSYVMYGVAAILLAEGVVDRALVLCPSTTIESGLIDKFERLAGRADLRDLLPKGAKLVAPSIINAGQSIVQGAICIENYHAILEHVGSSIRTTLTGKGPTTLVLNDEAHHIRNESPTKANRWKEFLTNPDFAFRYIIGLSGTCYIDDDYFADVIYRYSLRQAMEERYVKKVDYVAEMPRTSNPDEKWQLVAARHSDARSKLKKRKIRPLTIIVTPTISKCKDVAEELKAFLIEHCGLDHDAVDKQVLVVYNGAPDLPRLAYVDTAKSKVEWIVSVSMLNEGWDVKRVFQIVPHEERAFDSKLLISQVLGRGLRMPDGWTGEQPEVVVFNHDAWAVRIRHLVAEVLEREKRLSARVVEESPFHFALHNIEYNLKSISVKKPMEGSYRLLEKGYVDLAMESESEELNIEFERALTGERYKWQGTIVHKTYTPREVAESMYDRLEQAQDPDDPDPDLRTVYTDQFPVARLEKIVKDSLKKLKVPVATESMRQRFLQSLGTLRRKNSENVRYIPQIKEYVLVTTSDRHEDSVSAAELRSNKTFFYTDQTRGTLSDEQREFFDEVTESGSGYKCVQIQNRHDFKCPLNAVIAESENERRFINWLIQPTNNTHYDAWIKSTSIRFYEIDYSWKKGNAPKKGKFSPDFFIKIGDLILVVEVKGNEELADPAPENRKKYEYAIAHFKRVDEFLKKQKSPLRYKFTFLPENDFNRFFNSLRSGTIANWRSNLDVKLAEEE